MLSLLTSYRKKISGQQIPWYKPWNLLWVIASDTEGFGGNPGSCEKHPRLSGPFAASAASWPIDSTRGSDAWLC